MKRVALRRLAEINPPTPEFDALDSDDQVLFLPLETVWADSRADQGRRVAKSSVSSGYTRFRAGDIVCPKVTPTFQAARSMIATGTGAGTTELHVLRAHVDVDPRWILYAVRSNHFIEEGVTAFEGVAGLRRVPGEFVQDFKIADVSHGEQRRIADFLDERVARIDQIIAARRAQSRQIQAFASAQIDGLVREESLTIFRRLQDFTDPRRPIQYGIVLPGPDFPGGVPIIKGGDIGSGRLARLELNRTDPAIEAAYARSRVQPGDYVIAIRGSVGEIAEVPGSLTVANLTQDSARIAPKNCDPAWLKVVLESPSVQSQMQSLMTGSTVRGINIEALRRVAIPTADTCAQRVIADQGDRVRSTSAAHVAGLTRSIALLQEYKQSLITAAVTGELDVTTASTKIPGE